MVFMMPGETEAQAPPTAARTPREIVGELDKYVIGQKRAKKAVAIALRNRCRRQRLRSAIATAFFARFWPMTYLSSSPTISRGVRAAVGGACASVSPGIMKTMSDL